MVRSVPLLVLRQSKIVVLVFVLSAATRGSAEVPVAADSIADSVGVDIHLHYNDTVYGNFPLIEKLLVNLGARHTRDGLVDTQWQPFYQRHIALGRDHIRCLFITREDQSDQLLISWPARVPGAFEGYEAPNETDAGIDPFWAQNLVRFMDRLAHAVRSNSATASFPIVGPSLVRPDDARQISALGPDFDLANLHNYFAGRNPGTPGWGPDGYGSLSFDLNRVHSAWAAKPVITTETGYFTAEGQDRVPESVAGTYVPRLVFEQWMAGIRRTYFYELIDEQSTSKGAEGHFGLAHEDGSPKPAYRALQQMIALYHDPGPAFVAQPVDFHLSSATADVHHLTAVRRDGTILLAVWRELPIWDVHSQTSVKVDPVSVRVSSPHPWHDVQVHQLEEDGSWATHRIEEHLPVELSVSARVLILEWKE